MGQPDDPQRRGHVIGRYALHDPIASGGMATVYYGRLIGPVGFARTVAIKRLHPHVATEPEFSSMFLDEARLAARVHHPNVVPTLDVVALDRELLLVMEYVRGESLARLMSTCRDRNERIPIDVLVAIMAGALHGLHAAHEAKSERGEPLEIVHRDVSPQNVLVGVDGVARVLDFGVAKAIGRLQTTRDGRIKGKLAYMAPEQLKAVKVTRRTDVYAAGVVLWEGLTGKRLFEGEHEGAILEQVLLGYVDPPSRFVPAVPEALDAITMRALERDPDKRFQTAREMAQALERAVTPALASDVGAWVQRCAEPALTERAERVAEIESGASDPDKAPPPALPFTAGETSQISSISVAQSRPPVDGRARTRRRAVVAAAGALGLGVAMAAAYFAGSHAATDHAPEVTPASAAAAPPQEVADASVAIVAPSREPPPEPTAAPSATVAAAPAPAAPKRAKPVAPAPKDDCRVKFTVDATGRKIYKRNCL